MLTAQLLNSIRPRMIGVICNTEQHEGGNIRGGRVRISDGQSSLYHRCSLILLWEASEDLIKKPVQSTVWKVWLFKNRHIFESWNCHFSFRRLNWQEKETLNSAPWVTCSCRNSGCRCFPVVHQMLQVGTLHICVTELMSWVLRLVSESRRVNDRRSLFHVASSDSSDQSAWKPGREAVAFVLRRSSRSGDGRAGRWQLVYFSEITA